MEDLNHAVEVADMAVAATPPDHPNRAAILNNLGNWLSRRFERTGVIGDLNRAVEVTDIAVAATPPDHPNRAGYLNNLGIHLSRRFGRTGAMGDLNRAVEVADMVVAATPPNHPNRASWLNNLRIRLSRRFEQAGEIGDLNRAVEVADMAVAATSDHPDRVIYLNNLGNWLGRRFEQTGAVGDLNRAVEVTDMAVAATPPDHPDRVGRLRNLGSLLGRRFEQTGAIGDLNRAVEVADMALAATPPDHPDRANRLSNLGIRLGMRFGQTGAMGDLNRAIEVADMAVAATPPDHPNRAGQLSNLGNLLGRRFEQTGAVGDLNRAVEVTNMAVAATPPDHPNRDGQLSNLGSLLDMRFERTGAIGDLNRAVEVADIAVAATPPDHPDRAGYLNNLGSLLDRRFGRTRAMGDLDRAVEVADMALAATPPDHPDRVIYLNNLGNLLGTRFEQTGAVGDLNRAVKVADIAVAATPPDHPNRAGYLNNLGNLLSAQFERTGAMGDLNRAVKVTDMAVAATPPDHPSRAGYLKNLGSLLGRRFGQTRAMEDRERSLSSSKKGWNCHNAPPSVRIRLAQRAARLLALQLNWEESSTFLQDAVELLPTVSPRSLRHTDKQHMLGEFAGLASVAAATALNAGKEAYHALKLLELGRGVIAGLLLEMRTDISAFEQQHPKLAEEFASLRDELDSPTSGTALLASSDIAPSWVPQAERRLKAEQRFTEVVALIRTLPGFQNFLLPPTADELMAAADVGPIAVVNVSSYRCDAFLIERHQIRALELPKLKLKEVEERAQHLRSSGVTSSILEWLWDVAACPILEALGFHQPPFSDNWPHLWWVPTGALSNLPLHAAGRHAKGSTETVLDRVISSYNSSVKALIYGRRQSVRKSTEPASEHALLVAMRETPGLPVNSVLPFATVEVDMLNDLCPSLQLKPVKPPQRKKNILAYLHTCKIFHFAGHGKSDPLEPSRSCLLLEDWKDNPLTVGDLRDHKLQENPPFLGYLSACLTGANEAGRLIDEGIHLVSACQLAGFRHVIGTLWEVSDKHCVDVAAVLYETIRDEGMTDVALYRGLHRAIMTLRDGHIDKTSRRSVGGNEDDRTRLGRDATLCGYESRETGQESPQYWAPYVHFGV